MDSFKNSFLKGQKSFDLTPDLPFINRINDNKFRIVIDTTGEALGGAVVIH